MNPQRPPSDFEPPAAVDRLSRALAELEPRPGAVPRAVDQAILRAAASHLPLATPARNPAEPAPQPEPTGWWEHWQRALGVFRPRWIAWAAAAGVVALAAGMLQTRWKTHPTALAEDLNRDGRVDILDAYMLAQLVDRRVKLDTTLDLNGDGRVDRADADQIALGVVRLNSESRL